MGILHASQNMTRMWLEGVSVGSTETLQLQVCHPQILKYAHDRLAGKGRTHGHTAVLVCGLLRFVRCVKHFRCDVFSPITIPYTFKSETLGESKLAECGKKFRNNILHKNISKVEILCILNRE